MSIDFKKDILYRKLRDDLVHGKYKPGEKFPSELEFARQLQVGKVTLRSALEQLAADGLVVKIPRRGTFAAPENRAVEKKFLAVISSNDTGIEAPWHYILPSLEAAAGERNVVIEKCTVQFLRSMNTEEGIEQLKQNRIAGVFYFSNSVLGNEQDYLTLRASNLPVIMPHGSHNDYHTTGFAVMRTDERAAWSMGVKYLAAQGHRCIGTIWNGNLQKLWRGFTHESYAAFLSELGCSSSSELTAQCSYSYNEIDQAVRGFMHLERFPTAIICHSDYYALHVYRSLKALGIVIPQQVAVLGYSNYPGGKLCVPPLSTIDLCYDEVGRSALTLMLKAGRWHGHDTAPPLIYTNYRLIERKSSKIKRLERELT